MNIEEAVLLEARWSIDIPPIETRFNKWYMHNTYEVSYNTIRHFAEQADDPYFSGLEAVKDTVFVLSLNNLVINDFNKISPERVCTMLDDYFHTENFSTFFLANKDKINQYFDEQIYAMEEAPNQISLEYHLILPGKIFITNSDLNRNDTLIWRMSALRLYTAENYSITAESRKTNTWVFIVTFLVGIGAMFFIGRQRR